MAPAPRKQASARQIRSIDGQRRVPHPPEAHPVAQPDARGSWASKPRSPRSSSATQRTPLRGRSQNPQTKPSSSAETRTPRTSRSHSGHGPTGRDPASERRWPDLSDPAGEEIPSMGGSYPLPGEKPKPENSIAPISSAQRGHRGTTAWAGPLAGPRESGRAGPSTFPERGEGILGIRLALGRQGTDHRAKIPAAGSQRAIEAR